MTGPHTTSMRSTNGGGTKPKSERACKNASRNSPNLSLPQALFGRSGVCDSEAVEARETAPPRPARSADVLGGREPLAEEVLRHDPGLGELQEVVGPTRLRPDA